MAEEQLTLVDGMSPSLRRIYQEAEKLNRRMLTLRSNIKTLEKPTSMSYLRRELKSVETQAKATERALKAMKAAEVNNARFGAFKVGANGRYYLNGMQVRNADRLAMAEAYNRNIQNAQLRRNRLLWDTGRRVNGLTFDERLAMLNRGSIWDRLRQKSSDHFKNSRALPTLNDKFLQLAVTTGLVIGGLKSMFDFIHNTFIKTGDEYIGGITRVALTADGKYKPTQMMNQLYDTAIRTRADAKGTISLYNRIAMSGVKASNDRILRFVETFNKTMAISGTSAQENRAVMLQLAQGMGSNRLGGDEFRSIAEQAPMFKYMLARGMGVNPGALKQMGAEGKLTAEAIMTAMEKVQDQIDDVFRTAPWTIGQLLIVLQDKWQKSITQQFTGYIKLRDLVKDFVMWLDTVEGQKFIYNIIDGLNYLLTKFVELVRFLAPAFKWIVDHLKDIARWVGVFIALWASSKVPAILAFISTLIGNIAWGTIGLIANTQAFISFAVEGFTTLAGVLGITVGALGAVAGGIIAIVGAMYAFKHIKDELDPNTIRLNQQQKNARFQYEQELDKAIFNKIGPKPTFMYAKGSSTVLSEKDQKLVDDYNKKYLEAQRQKKQLMNQWDVDAKEGVLRKFSKEDMLTDAQKAMRDINNATNQFYGKMDSSKNIPMDVKGGKLDSVGKINDDVSLDNDGIEMMKMIAERQWTLQNEVTVPQKVEVTIDRTVDMNEETIMSKVTEGTRMAVASSMRGVAQPA